MLWLWLNLTYMFQVQNRNVKKIITMIISAREADNLADINNNLSPLLCL